MKKQGTKHKEILNEDTLHTLENDHVWSLLEEASCEKARPSFIQNVMRDVRLSEADNQENASWWAKLFSPRFYVPACGVAAAVAVCFSVLSGEESVTNPVEIPTGDITAESESDFIAQELDALEAEDPIIMTADEIGMLLSSNDEF